MEMTIVTQVVFKGTAVAWKELQEQNSPCLSPFHEELGLGWAIESILWPCKCSAVASRAPLCCNTVVFRMSSQTSNRRLTWELLQTQISSGKPTKSETLGMGPNNFCLNKPSSRFWCMLKYDRLYSNTLCLKYANMALLFPWVVHRLNERKASSHFLCFHS